MVKFKSGNHALDAAYVADVPLAGTTKRELVYKAIRDQLSDDNKRPWALAQKLRDPPYRYNYDTLWAALNSISHRLDAGTPKVTYETEGRDFSEFVTKQLSGTLNELINGIVKASKL